MSTGCLAALLALMESLVQLRDGCGMCELTEQAAVQTESKAYQLHPQMSQLSGSDRNSSWTVTQCCCDPFHSPSLSAYLSVLHISKHFPLFLPLALSPLSMRASLLSGFLPDFFCPIKILQHLNHIWKAVFHFFFLFQPNTLITLFIFPSLLAGNEGKKEPKARKPRKKMKLYCSCLTYGPSQKCRRKKQPTGYGSRGLCLTAEQEREI